MNSLEEKIEGNNISPLTGDYKSLKARIHDYFHDNKEKIKNNILFFAGTAVTAAGVLVGFHFGTKYVSNVCGDDFGCNLGALLGSDTGALGYLTMLSYGAPIGFLGASLIIKSGKLNNLPF